MGWKEVASEKRESVKALIPREWRLESIPSIEQQKDVTGAFIHQYLSKEEITITESDAIGIVDHTTTGKWSALEVITAFCHRAALAHQLVNCLHEIFFEAAIEDAKRLDEYFKKEGKPIGPLHGLPVSLKDQFHVKGVGTHMGYVGWIGSDKFEGKTDTKKAGTYESEMVKELRGLGAVLYCKTSVPHTLMCGETINNIIEYTYNPKNRYLTSGGSSGGEGALIGLRGSPIGFGTDIGGSIRIPAAFNGLYGLRPSAGRLPYYGMANSMDGQNSVLSVVGPLATSADALRLVTTALLSTQPWLHDPLVLEIPWRQSVEDETKHAFQTPGGMAFGVMRDDGQAIPHPPVARAINMVVDALSKLGHKAIDWKPTPTHPALCNISYKSWDFDGGADCRAAFELSGEPPAPEALLANAPQANATDIMKTNIEKREALKEYMEYWNSSEALTGTGRPVDAVIAPLAPFPAARKGAYTYYGYSVWVNTLDYTSVVIPVTKSDKSIDKVVPDFVPKTEDDKKTMDTYDPEIFDGSHVCVQLVGRRLQEEKMIALAKLVTDALK
ncbi:amidase [Polychaeton citri CBS 116435]|uniref:amidase n=1 Tax=Polychaeton citri CBS 116435 TaxID=1314669 RepID=A0A9P4QI33_9PEZI|nr:amidase [Polychaeton citri CBS 116435]